MQITVSVSLVSSIAFVTAISYCSPVFAQRYFPSRDAVAVEEPNDRQPASSEQETLRPDQDPPSVLEGTLPDLEDQPENQNDRSVNSIDPRFQILPNAVQAAPESQTGDAPLENGQVRALRLFPLVLDRTVRRYVIAYLDHFVGLRQSFVRSAPFIPEMARVFHDQGIPGGFVYLAFAESGFTGNGAGPWQFTRVTARRF